MTGYRVKAMLRLASTEDGGLIYPQPSGTKSILLQFPSVDDANPGPVMLGAVLTPQNGGQVAPGQVTEADVLFWNDEARIYATTDASFDLWYGRTVGHGTVISVVDDLNGESAGDQPTGGQS